MNPNAMYPFGQALMACFNGDTSAELIIRRDDGDVTPLPVSYFFRDSMQFSAIDQAALDRCTPPVLDVGAGTGLHSLELQQRGFPVTAIDVNSQAVEIMERRGVKDARCIDIFEFEEKKFNTLLMLGHGLGMVESIAGLERFLEHARYLLPLQGQILVDSLDVRITDDPANIEYHDANKKAGRYIGEIRMQFEFREMCSPYFGWLHVDQQTLAEHAEKKGLSCKLIRNEKSGEYLAALIKS